MSPWERRLIVLIGFLMFLGVVLSLPECQPHPPPISEGTGLVNGGQLDRDKPLSPSPSFTSRRYPLYRRDARGAQGSSAFACQSARG
jgi:hypothetical protein